MANLTETCLFLGINVVGFLYLLLFNEKPVAGWWVKFREAMLFSLLLCSLLFPALSESSLLICNVFGLSSAVAVS